MTMSMTDEIEPVLSPPSAAEAIDDLKASGGLDALFAKIDAGLSCNSLVWAVSCRL